MQHRLHGLRGKVYVAEYKRIFEEESEEILRVFEEVVASNNGKFTAIATQRSGSRDVAEMNRVLNSFLQYLEDDDSEGLIVTASNHPEIVDKALFRRFDAVIRYRKPGRDEILLILRDRLSAMNCPGLDKPTAILDAAIGLSQAEVVAVANEALKSAILDGVKEISDTLLIELLQIRQTWNQEGLG